MNINLFQNYYYEKNDKRRAEIDLCMRKNFSNHYLNFVPIESQARMTYNDFFAIANSYCNDDDVNIIANLDIYFDETVALATKVGKNDFWCLGRWEWKSPTSIINQPRPDSQDAWFWRGKMTAINGGFEMGKMGCDNRLAYEAVQAKYNVINPALTVKAIHVHTSNVRNYNRKVKTDTIPGPYHTIYPTVLK